MDTWATQCLADVTAVELEYSHASNGAVPAESATTTKWLEVLGGLNQRWRLPDDANLDVLEALIKRAFACGEALSVEVYADNRSSQRRIVLNGRALPFVCLLEVSGIPDQDESAAVPQS